MSPGTHVATAINREAAKRGAHEKSHWRETVYVRIDFGRKEMGYCWGIRVMTPMIRQEDIR